MLGVHILEDETTSIRSKLQRRRSSEEIEFGKWLQPFSSKSFIFPCFPYLILILRQRQPALYLLFHRKAKPETGGVWGQGARGCIRRMKETYIMRNFIRDLYCPLNVIKAFKSKMLRWTGYVACVGISGHTKTLVKIPEGTISTRKTWSKMEDNIITILNKQRRDRKLQWLRIGSKRMLSFYVIKKILAQYTA
jgi:hypothetical protein